MLNSIPIKIRLILLIAVPQLALIFVLSLGIKGMSDIRNDLELIYAEQLLPIDNLRKIQDAYLNKMTSSNEEFTRGELSPVMFIRALEKTNTEALRAWSSYKAATTTTTPSNAELAISTSIEKISQKIENSSGQFFTKHLNNINTVETINELKKTCHINKQKNKRTHRASPVTIKDAGNGRKQPISVDQISSDLDCWNMHSVTVHWRHNCLKIHIHATCTHQASHY